MVDRAVSSKFLQGGGGQSTKIVARKGKSTAKGTNTESMKFRGGSLWKVEYIFSMFPSVMITKNSSTVQQVNLSQIKMFM